VTYTEYVTSVEYVNLGAAFFAARRYRLVKESCLD